MHLDARSHDKPKRNEALRIIKSAEIRNVITLDTKAWLHLVKISILFFLYLLRQNAFQVIAVDGVCSGIIQCPSAEECTDWLQAIASNISALTKHNVRVSAAFVYEILINFKASCSDIAGREWV